MDPNRGRIFIGTSGWTYPDWKNGVFYPKGLVPGRWLEYYAQHFSTVEVNNTFYRLPPPQAVDRWRRRVGDDFVFALKVSRYLTHILRLRNPRPPLDRFLRSAARLKHHLGPILFQLPPGLHCDLQLLEGLLRLRQAQHRRGTRWTIEFRHPSWFNPEVYGLLETSSVALCFDDGPQGPHERPVTTDWIYIRRHQGRAKDGRYTRAQLEEDAVGIRSWVERGLDVYCYFNNDKRGHAVKDAAYLQKRLGDLA